MATRRTLMAVAGGQKRSLKVPLSARSAHHCVGGARMYQQHRAPAAAVLALSGFLLFGVRPSLASATLSCDADDKALKFSVQAVVSHGLGESRERRSSAVRR